MPLEIGDLTQSSVRGLNCSLKWGNERNPRCLLYVSGETAPHQARRAWWGSSKSQAPNHKQISSFKFKISNETKSLRLKISGFGYLVLFGIWCLVLGIFPNQLCWFGAGRKARMTPDQHGPLIPWATHAIQWLLQHACDGVTLS